MIDIKQIEMEFNAFFGDTENEHNLLKRMKPLIGEVKRLRKMIVGYGHSIQLSKEDMKEAKKEMIE